MIIYNIFKKLRDTDIKEVFKEIKKIRYEGPNSKNPLSFKFYDADKVVLGKTMQQHLPFAMAWWHNLCATGADMFGKGVADKSFGANKNKDVMELAKAKVDAGFEFMEKLGIKYYCFHDNDLLETLTAVDKRDDRFEQISDYMLIQSKKYGIQCLWGTANLFFDPRYLNGAGSSNCPKVYALAAARIKNALDLTVKLGGRGFVFWGGREGYDPY